MPSLELLAPGGRLVVISFHSLEDRIVKHFIARESSAVFDRRAPFAPAAAAAPACAGAASSPAKPRLRANPRARSAVMRVAERTAVPGCRRADGPRAHDGGRVMINRLNAVLLLVLLCSSLYLVRVATTRARLFTALDRAQSEARQLDVEHERLQAELQAQATPLRIEKAAREKLAMRNRDAGGDPLCRRARPRRPGAVADAPAAASAAVAAVTGMRR